jgi:HEAT repeat protein
LKSNNRFLNILSNETASLSDKKQAWEDLIHQTHAEDSSRRLQAAYALGSAFSYVPDKDLAWADLIKLTNNIYGFVRYIVASVLGSVFSYVPNKN